jgi:SAM-dependent methyltransferase
VDFTSTAFADQVRAYWTPERERRVTGGKNLLLLPSTAPALMRWMGLMNADASMSAKAIRKYRQINHMLSRLRDTLDLLCRRHPCVRVLDAGCGNSYLTFLLAWYFREHRGHPCEILGVDHHARLMEECQQAARVLGYDGMLRFEARRLSQVEGDFAPHLVVALHACDTATDDALRYGLRTGADVIAVAPCCQAELARLWTACEDHEHPMSVVFQRPNLRREAGALMTDAQRVAAMEALGYRVLTEDFVPSEHTPKNRMIQCFRPETPPACPDFRKLRALVEATGHMAIAFAGELLEGEGTRPQP